MKKNSLYSDDVLPEYVVLLLANRHPKEKILVDLDGLLGPEIAAAFTTWLFEEVERLKSGVIPAVPEPVSAPEPAPVVDNFAPDQEMRDSRSSRRPESNNPERFADNRLFSTAMRDVNDRPSRRREPGRSDAVPEDGYRTRRNRSVSPVPMEDSDERHSRRVVVRRGDEDRVDRDRGGQRDSDRPQRTISRAEGGTLKIQVSDARQLIGREDDRRRSPRRGSLRRGMDIEPMPAMDQHHFGGAEIPPAERAPKIRCPDFPNCKTEACQFYHPKRICTYFPNCANAATCTFIHPEIPCKYQSSCNNPLCNYYHSPELAAAFVPKPAPSHVPAYAAASGSTVLCKFHPNCVNPHCTFLHPIEVACKFGENCQRPGCHFKHPQGHVVVPKTKIFTPCIYGPRCAKPGCPYQHPPAEPEAMVVEPTPSTVSETAPAAQQPALDTAANPVAPVQ